MTSDPGVWERRIDKLIRFMQAELETLATYRAASNPGSAPSFSAERYLKLRRYRESLFPRDLFADPAWDILLDLLVSERQGKAVSISAACMASGSPATTALRYIGKLEKAGLLERHPDPRDGRRIELSLSPVARDALLAWELEGRTAETIRRSVSRHVIPKGPASPAAEA